MSGEKVRPINPKEIVGKKLEMIPNEVFEAFNELIAQNFNNGEAVVSQREVLALMVSKGLNQGLIYKNGWLDIEDVYRKEGWTVEYDKPGYNEDYEPTFTFKQGRKR